MLDARLVIERHAAKTAIGAGRHHDLAADLYAILRRHDQAAASRDPRRCTELGQLFHGALVDAAGNRLLATFYATLHDRQLRMGTAALRRDPDRYEAILAEHAALAKLIDSGDVEAVARALDGHLTATRAPLSAG